MKAFPKINRARAQGSLAFSLIEIMVVVALMSVIILGLMSMFTQTQRAFRLGMTQTDVLESGRIATDLISRELSQITPNYTDGSNSAPNFYSQIRNIGDQDLPTAGIPVARSNILEDLFFVTRENQLWTGIGYFVRHNPTNISPVSAGTLYRFQMTNTFARFEQKPKVMFGTFANVLGGTPVPNSANVSKILDGVVSFRLRAYDTNGYWIAPLLGGPLPYRTNIFANPRSPVMPGMDEINDYTFYSNAVPAFVELEIGILEQKTLELYNSIPSPVEQQKFLRKQAAHVHLFRQRVSIRNVDWSAYQ